MQVTALSATIVVLTWKDVSLGPSQHVTDNRFYTVRYRPLGGRVTRKPKLVNSTSLHILIKNLKPGTEYEFSVQVVKGTQQSAWSSVLNKTKEMGKKLISMVYGGRLKINMHVVLNVL